MKEIIYSKQAQKFLQKQTLETKKRIMKAIQKLPIGDVKKLKGHTNYFRLRVGDYRVIYNEELIVIQIVDIGNRGDIYKKYER